MSQGQAPLHLTLRVMHSSQARLVSFGRMECGVCDGRRHGMAVVENGMGDNVWQVYAERVLE